MSTLLHQEISTPSTRNFLPLNGIDYVEFYVGNARQASYFYRMGLGMRLVAYAGPETGQRDQVSFVLQQGKICFVLTTPLRPDNEIAEHIHRHGDGVHDIALGVDDARGAWRETTRRGARSVREPRETKDSDGAVRTSSIAAYGDTVHTFVERHNYRGAFLPGYWEVPHDSLAHPTGLVDVDHIVANVGWNARSRWINFYSDAMGFEQYQNFDGQPNSSAPSCAVVGNESGRVKFPIQEPAQGSRSSQVEKYLEFYHGPGVQRIALTTTDILYTVAKMQEHGVEFLKTPHAYYAGLHARTGRIDEPIGDLERLGILAERDDDGYILQAFTRPLEDRSTLFLEIVQRKGSRSFGEESFEMLFEAFEQEQAGCGRP